MEVTSAGASVASLDIVTPDELTAAIEAAKVSAATGDLIITVANNKISSTLGINYDSAAKKIQLLGIADNIIDEIDATAFIKDGMVDTVEFDPSTKKLTITFNTESGKEAIEVDMTSLVDTYTAGNGIDITGNSVAVKVDAAGEAYLSVGASGVKLAGVDAAIATAKTEAVADAKTKADTAEANAKAYADDLASNYATAEQGAKADTALQTITTTANGGLKVTGVNQIDIDDEVTFVFDCGDSN